VTRETFVHEATVELTPGSDAGALGAAVTVELCGHWEHEPPCRWPHNTAVELAAESRTAVRTVFVAAAEDEVEVRSRVERGLRRGELAAREGRATWRTVVSGARAATHDEAMLGARLKG
jgi:hypothetical protein